MKDSSITIERYGSGVARLNMQDREGNNSLSPDFVDLLERRFEEITSDPDIKVCLLRGLPEIFSSGGDKETLLALARGKIAPVDIMLSRSVIDLPVVTIAVMEGHAVGGGLTLGLCCDIVLMARESRYGCSFMNMGFTPGMGTTAILEQAVGPYLAAEMIYTGRFFRGSHFDGRSQVNGVHARDDIDGRALDIATRIAEKPRHALQLAKRSLSLPKRLAFERARTAESFMHELCFARDETRALIEEGYLD